jgi:hypothetical protein
VLLERTVLALLFQLLACTKNSTMQKPDWETMSAAKKIAGEEHSLMCTLKTGRLANTWANEQRPRKINQRKQTPGAIRTTGQQCAHGQKFKMRKIKPEWSTMREGKNLITKGRNLAADLNDESIGLASKKQADCRRWEQQARDGDPGHANQKKKNNNSGSWGRDLLTGRAACGRERKTSSLRSCLPELTEPREGLSCTSRRKHRDWQQRTEKKIAQI